MEDPTGVFVPFGVGAVVLAIGRWFAGREIARIDRKLELVDKLAAESARREDIERAARGLNDAITALRGDVLERIGEVRQIANRANERIDVMLRSHENGGRA